MTLLLPIIIPLLYLIFALFKFNFKWRQRMAVVAAALNFLAALHILFQVEGQGMQKIQMGSWPAPYGITMLADHFCAIMLVTAAFLYLMFTIYSIQAIDRQRRENGFYFFSFGVIMGVNGSFLAADIFNLYVWFEVMLMSSFILMSFGNSRKQLEGSIKYLILNIISSFFFVAGIGLLYGKMGTLNMADLSQKIAASKDSLAIINPALILIFVGFSIKSALFPFFFWLPASYHTPPPAITALFAALLTKVGIYSLIRFYSLYLYHDMGFWNPLILTFGVLSMVIGVFTATSQYDFSKVLSFHIISQIGYVVMALGFFTVAGLTGAIFFLVHNMLSKTLAYLVAGYVHQQKGTLSLKKLGDIYREQPIWGILFLVAGFSLAGFPPLSGFVAKYLVLKAGIEAGYTTITIIALFVGLFTLFSMVKIWLEAFWKPRPELRPLQPRCHPPKSNTMLFAAIMLGVAIVVMGSWAQPMIDLCQTAAEELMAPQQYINFVMGQ
ncbi:MAG: proton-conducting transporter transmembrane domain-containing protein [Breznakibacter sp.]